MTDYLITITLPLILLTLAVGYLVGIERGWWGQSALSSHDRVVFIERDHQNLRMLPDTPPYSDLTPEDPYVFIWRVHSGAWFRFKRSGPSGSWSLARLNNFQHKLDPELGEIVTCSWTTVLMFNDGEWKPKNSLDQVREVCLKKLTNNQQKALQDDLEA